MTMKTVLPVVFVLLLGFPALARIMRDWSYQERTDGADLIVIATPVAVKDTTEKTTIPGIQRVEKVNQVGRPVPAIGVESTFEVLSVLKGDKGVKTFVLYHLRLEKPELMMNGPGLVSFEPKDKKRYLLFLKREPDGRYSSLTGQTDPDMGVKTLGVDPPIISVKQ